MIICVGYIHTPQQSVGAIRGPMPESGRRRQAGEGRDLPDADGPGYSLNGGSREANRSLIGHMRSFDSSTALLKSGLSQLPVR